jgi:hypothetical protein
LLQSHITSMFSHPIPPNAERKVLSEGKRGRQPRRTEMSRYENRYTTESDDSSSDLESYSELSQEDNCSEGLGNRKQGTAKDQSEQEEDEEEESTDSDSWKRPKTTDEETDEA